MQPPTRPSTGKNAAGDELSGRNPGGVGALTSFLQPPRRFPHLRSPPWHRRILSAWGRSMAGWRLHTVPHQWKGTHKGKLPLCSSLVQLHCSRWRPLGTTMSLLHRARQLPRHSRVGTALRTSRGEARLELPWSVKHPPAICAAPPGCGSLLGGWAGDTQPVPSTDSPQPPQGVPGRVGSSSGMGDAGEKGMLLQGCTSPGDLEFWTELCSWDCNTTLWTRTPGGCTGCKRGQFLVLRFL